jgi:signal transduction histidine kinase
MHQKKPIILIVDDDSTNIDLLLNYFESYDLIVESAKDGKSGIQEASRLQPNLILLDVMMPGINGFETCRRLKANPKTKHIPVIFMTALKEKKVKLKGFEAGGVDYIAKPFYHEEVLARVNAQLSLQSLQQQLQEQNRQLRELNENKDRFLSIVANDLKKPFASIFVAAEQTKQHLQRQAYDDAQHTVENLQAAVENYNELLENLLLWAKIQQNLLTFNPQPVDMAQIVAKHAALFTPSALEKHINVHNNMPTRMPLCADLNMVETTVRNLLSNAIKYTGADGHVEIGAVSDDHAITLSVADTGIGIPKDKLPALFQIETPYRQLGTAEEKGTGLGLILCKEFMEKHGGRIWAESEAGRGSTFYIHLPENLT